MAVVLPALESSFNNPMTLQKVGFVLDLNLFFFLRFVCLFSVCEYIVAHIPEDAPEEGIQIPLQMVVNHYVIAGN